MIITIIGQLCYSISQLAWTFTVVHLESDCMCLKESISYELEQMKEKNKWIVKG